MEPLLSRIQDYLHDVLGTSSASAQPWPKAGALPFFIADTFDLVELPIFGQQVLVAIAKPGHPLPPTEVASRLAKIRAKAQEPVLYATPKLASYERKRLIEQRVPFVVPGNQLYLPDLGLDLREHFRRGAEIVAREHISPSTQALLIAHLLTRPWSSEWRPSTTARELNYTAMTASRAASELTALQLAEAQTRSRSQVLIFNAATPRDVWNRAGPTLRSPVQRAEWIAGLPPNHGMRLAGTSALARRSMINDPRHQIFAIERKIWLAMKTDLRVEREPGPDTVKIQIWGYSPALLRDQEDVDPLSLILSLRDESDERIQTALEELEESLPW